jgi:hypothetical protein
MLNIIHIKVINQVRDIILLQKQIKNKLLLVASGYSDFTIHKDEQRKQRYINRHKKQMKFSQNLAKIPPGFGLVGCSGISQQ